MDGGDNMTIKDLEKKINTIVNKQSELVLLLPENHNYDFQTPLWQEIFKLNLELETLSNKKKAIQEILNTI